MLKVLTGVIEKKY